MTADGQVLNLAAYRFKPLAGLETLKPALAQRCRALGLKGTILLSPEGVNVFLAGRAPAVEEMFAELKRAIGSPDWEGKRSWSDTVPFKRMILKIKRELVPMGREVRPHEFTGPVLPAVELRRWIEEGRDFTLLDTRNAFEVGIGTFQGATHLAMNNFREFPEKVRALPPELKSKPVVMFCTGGIRCEKASPFLLREGFAQVYQLEGGILKYFEECGAANYNGSCFVFDERIALDGQLHPAAVNPELPLMPAPQPG